MSESCMSEAQALAVEVRILCPTCGAHSIVSTTQIGGGLFRCTTCQQVSELDPHALRACASNFVQLVTRLSESHR